MNENEVMNQECMLYHYHQHTLSQEEEKVVATDKKGRGK
jgi:hypothetical protein